MNGEAKRWWQVCRADEFKERIETMDRPELLVLGAEIKGSLSVISGQLSSRALTPDPSKEWLGKAKAALGFISEKKSILNAHIFALDAVSRAKRAEVRSVFASQRDARHERRDNCILLARKAMESGDLAGALSQILDLLEG